MCCGFFSARASPSQQTHQRQEVGGALLERGAKEAVEHLDVDEVDGQLARVLVELLAVGVIFVFFWRGGVGRESVSVRRAARRFSPHSCVRVRRGAQLESVCCIPPLASGASSNATHRYDSGSSVSLLSCAEWWRTNALNWSMRPRRVVLASSGGTGASAPAP